MRFAKHILPLALVITGVIAADDESTTEVAKAKATATDDKATKTTNEPDETKGSDKTEEAEATATGDDKDSTETGKETETEKNSKAKATSATETEQSIVSWDPPQPTTMAPDINASSRSVQASGYLAVAMVGIVSIAAAFL